jgi:hypothetical protein
MLSYVIFMRFSPFEVETELYGKDASDISALLADNINLNRAISRLLQVPRVGCASHRFSLAIHEL